MAAMPNNEHLPIFRETADYTCTWQCTCGTINPCLWGTGEGAMTSWLEHVVNASLWAAGLGDEYELNSPIDLVRSI